ncbi:hypothetical protein CMV_009276 [Castanea mollissima]|uniref:Uncharacterized protein n=1 Tax=Castanea mollissima TaxID=60419 RepID=A0A8J4VR23_9ROSI|nr:hypothetical protein CMV_009276 [Castanea mollissima]
MYIFSISAIFDRQITQNSIFTTRAKPQTPNSNLWRTTSEEKRELERLEKPMYNSVRRAAEVHRQPYPPLCDVKGSYVSQHFPVDFRIPNAKHGGARPRHQEPPPSPPTLLRRRRRRMTACLTSN